MSTISAEGRSQQLTSQVVRAGKRTYFFDLKAGPKGGLYLAISETAIQDEGVFTRNRLLVSDLHIREFYEGLCESIKSLREEQKKREAPAEAAKPKPTARKKAAA